MADEVRDGLAGYDDLAGDVERRGGLLLRLSRKKGAGAEQNTQQASELSRSGMNHEDSLCLSSSQFTWTAKSISQRLAGFEGEGDALLRFWLAAEGEEGFALEVEDVLFADQGSRCDAASGENVSGPASDFLVMFGCVAGLAHEKDTGLEGGQGRCAGCGNLRARLRRHVAGVGERCGLGLCVEKQPLAIEGDAV